MKNTLLILYLLLFFIFNVKSQNKSLEILPNIPLLDHFTPNDYQGGIQNWAFDQNSEGVLYVANNDGLLEFDGRKWNKYDVPNSTRLRAVKVDSHDRIFVGGQGQIGYFSKTKNDFNFYLSFKPFAN